MTNKIPEVHITSSFMKFLNKNDNSITKILDIVSSFKKFTLNTYLYSINNPPPRATYINTLKNYLLDAYYTFHSIVLHGILL